MKYNQPKNVRSPRGYAKQITPIYDGGSNGFSIAILKNSNGNHNIGIRWNISEKEWRDKRKTEETKVCVGMPQSRGYSVWFIVPDTMWQYVPQMIKDEISINKKPNLINITEAKIQEAIDKIITERFGKQTLGSEGQVH